MESLTSLISVIMEIKVKHLYFWFSSVVSQNISCDQRSLTMKCSILEGFQKTEEQSWVKQGIPPTLHLQHRNWSCYTYPTKRNKFLTLTKEQTENKKRQAAWSEIETKKLARGFYQENYIIQQKAKRLLRDFTVLISLF